jgi:hypothetical protein
MKKILLLIFILSSIYAQKHSLISVSGTKYRGRIISGTKASGSGIFTVKTHKSPDGKDRYGYQYEGEFVGRKFHGSGTFTYPNGNRYTGEFKNGRFQGYGEYYYKNGSVFKGRWSFDKKNGFGILTKSDGTVQSGIWEHDYYKLDQSGNSVIKSTKEDLKYTKPRHPAFLIIDNLQLIEPSGNKSLDAMEKGTITFDLLNKGRGYASNMKVTATSLTFGKNIDYIDTIILKELDSKSSETINIPISADKNVKTENREFKIDITEHFGFDADPAVISFTTTAFVPSNLQIEKIIVDDDEDGDSFGNGNGIIEPGESIEVVVVFKNSDGDAQNVQAEVLFLQTNKNLIYPDDGHVYDLGNIASGSSSEIKFYFFTNKRYDQESLPISIKLTGAIGVKEKTLALGLNVGKHAQTEKYFERKMETVITKDGKEINGFIIKKDSNHIWMEDLDGKTIKISVDEIEFIRSDRTM